MAKEKGWAIASDTGLYVGWSMTRKEAIAEHINALFETRGSGWGALTAEQRKFWRQQQRKGDRAVKVTISYSA